MTIRSECDGKLVCCWGSPELPIFAEAGRDDGIDAMQSILKRMSHLKNAKTKGIKIDITRRFSMSMDCLTPIFGMRRSAHHTALLDCDGEAVVITAFIRYIAQFDYIFE